MESYWYHNTQNAAHGHFIYFQYPVFVVWVCSGWSFGADQAEIQTCLLYPHFINTLTQPQACSELQQPKMINCNLGAFLAYCTIRGPNSDFWTFMHTVPALLESQHTAGLFFLLGCTERYAFLPVLGKHCASMMYVSGFYVGNNYFQWSTKGMCFALCIGRSEVILSYSVCESL